MDAEVEWEEVFLELTRGKKNFRICDKYCCTKPDKFASLSNRICRFIFCCPCLAHKRKNPPLTPKEKVLNLLSYK